MNFDVNPFSTRFWIPGTIPFRFGRPEESVDRLLRRISEESCGSKNRRVFQIVGPHGSGKSTLVESLKRRLEESGRPIRHAVLNDEKRRLPPEFIPCRVDPSTVFFLDGYEQLGVFDRFRFWTRPWKKTGGLILTSHRPLARIPVLYRTSTDFNLFEKLVGVILAETSFSFDRSDLADVFSRSGGNLRSAFFELYDLFPEKETDKIQVVEFQ